MEIASRSGIDPTNKNNGLTAPASGDTNITIYTWDNRGRLTQVTFSQNFGTVTQTEVYVYDAYNRWVGETVTNGSGSVISQQAFIYDGDQIVLQFASSGSGTLAASNLSDRYLWGPAVDELLAQEAVQNQQTSGTILWALTDNQNTVRDMASYSGGATSVAATSRL